MAEKEIRPIRVEGNIAYVPLTQGYEAVIDATDVPKVSSFNWRAQEERRKDGSLKTVYAVRMEAEGTKRKAVLMHRVIAAADGRDLVDHRDTNGLNNRNANLRHATPSQNSQNRRRRADNTSGVKGVSQRRGVWLARICVSGKEIQIGRYNCRTAAALAYAKASAALHQEFGRTA